MTQAREELWRRHPGLVWSNPKATDEVRIRAALLRPRFIELLDIAVALGIEAVETEWALLKAEATPEAQRAAPVVERILSNIRRGAALASRGD